MRKVVINKCFGGFEMSLLGRKRYLELIGKEAFFYTTEWVLGMEGGALYKRVELEGSENRWFVHVSTEDLGESAREIPSRSYWSAQGLDRDDPKLVQVVEELGSKVNSNYSDLKVVEIPKDVSWHVEEYDGLEHIAEDHRTWG